MNLSVLIVVFFLDREGMLAFQMLSVAFCLANLGIILCGFSGSSSRLNVVDLISARGLALAVMIYVATLNIIRAGNSKIVCDLTLSNSCSQCPDDCLPYWIFSDDLFSCEDDWFAFCVFRMKGN